MSEIILEDKMVKYPRKWRHKENGKTIKVVPWWEMIEPETILHGKVIDVEVSRKFKIGALVQCGWLLENDEGVFFGFDFQCESYFEDLGEWEIATDLVSEGDKR